jgi:hypothetical protein
MEGSRRPGGLDEISHLRAEAIAGILVKLITMGTSEQDPVTEQEASDQGGEPAEAADCDLSRHDVGKGCSRVGGSQSPIRYRQDGNQPGTKRKPMHLAIGGAEHQPSIHGRGGVVGMFFHVGRQFEDGAIVGLFPERPPGGGGSGNGGCCRRPEAAPDRDPVVDHQGQWPAVPDHSAGRLDDAIEMP